MTQSPSSPTESKPVHLLPPDNPTDTTSTSTDPLDQDLNDIMSPGYQDPDSSMDHSSELLDPSEPSTSDGTQEPFASSSVAAVASRRRMAFVNRDRSASQVKMESATSVPTGQPIQPPPLRVKRPWTIEEVGSFFEGIKIYGKDFDSIVKFLARRKINKTKEHIKTFFFNSVKSYRALLSLTDDDFGHLSRDARELFLLINACEWKRKTINSKIQIDKFRELLFQGVVTVRAGRRFVTIRTPPCPALCRYFNIKKADKVPQDVYVLLEPTSNSDHVFMRNRDQNPYLRVKLSTNDRIMKLIDFLHRKWASAGDGSPISVTLWPDSSCEIASLTVTVGDNSPFISLSMNKLIKNIEEQREKSEKKAGSENLLKLGVDVNTKVKPNHTVIYPKPFVLTDSVIADGLTCRNVRNAIMAELYLVCGRKNPIKLRYQVQPENPDPRPFEPWRSLISLLDLGYGEALAPKKNIGSKKQGVTAKEEEYVPPPPKKAREAPPKKKNTPVPEQLTINPLCDIVRQENEDFESQLALLKKTSRHKTVAPKRKSTNPALATRTPQLAIRPSEITAPDEDTVMSLSQQVFTAPKCTIVPKRPGYEGFTHLIKSPSVKKANSMPLDQLGLSLSSSQPSTSQQKSLPIDFSSVVFSPAKKHTEMELQKKRTDDFLSSLKTPVDTPNQTPQKTVFQQYFGDELSMSPGSTRHATQFELDTANASFSSVIDFTDMMFNQLRDNDSSLLSNQDLDISVSDLVQQQYLDMMSSSQNSHDYVMGQFASKRKGTPRRKQQK